MLYLAEIHQKPKSSFSLSSKGKTELKLLACQRTEQNWSAISGEELVNAPDEANNFSPGALVLIEMNANRQIQSPIREAGKQLVVILQNLSRQIEKDKKESDEIESWRQSLSLQSQQLQLRQEEIYAREEDLENTRAELDRLTLQAESIKAFVTTQEQSRQELAAQWEELHIQQQSMAGTVSELQIAEIRTAINHLGGKAGAFNPQQLEITVEAIESQQDLLNRHWDEFRQHQQRVLDTQRELDLQEQAFDRGKQQLQELETALTATQLDWEVQQHTLKMRQEYVASIATQLGLEQENYQRIYRMSQGGTDVGNLDINIEQLQAMPIEELQAIVKNLQAEVDRSVQFVHLEEEELEEKQVAIDELRQAILGANEFDRFKLEADLVDEQDGYNMLDHTLDGQRQTIRERQAYLQVHDRVLQQRQGRQSESADCDQIKWESILQILANQRQEQQLELDRVEAEIPDLLAHLEQTKVKLEQQSANCIHEAQQMQALEVKYQATKNLMTELAIEATVSEKIIKPLQDRLDAFKQQLADLADAIDSQPANDPAMHQIESLLSNLLV